MLQDGFIVPKVNWLSATIMKDAVTLRVLVFRQGDHYIAECLDYELTVQSRVLDELAEAFVSALRVTYNAYAREGKSMFDIHPRASKQLNDLYLHNAYPAAFPDKVDLGGVSIRPEARTLVALAS